MTRYNSGRSPNKVAHKLIIMLKQIHFRSAFFTGKIKKTGCFCVLFLIFFLTANASNLHHNTSDDELRNVSADRIWAQTLEGSYFNEFWNYQFYFDNGMKLHIVFSAANFGSLKSPVTGVRASVFYPDGTVHQISREYPLERLVQDKETYTFLLRPDREIYFTGKLPEEHRVVMKTTKDGVSYDIDISFENIERGFMWNDGKFQIKNETVGIVTHIPFADVSGHISVNEKHDKVRGTAYMDHTHQHQTTTHMMDSGYRFIQHEDRDNWNLLYMLIPANSKPIGYKLSNEKGEIELSIVEEFSLVADGKAFGKTFPRIVDITLESSQSIRIARTEDQERFSILSELSWIARRAARTFLGGEVVDFRGEGTLMERSKKPKHGDYNFFFVE